MRDTVTLWTGRPWRFAQPCASQVHAADWHALAYINRYGGSVGAYAVMEHQVRGVWLAEDLLLPIPIRVAFAVHDTPETYVPFDIPGPVVAYLRRVQAETGVTDPMLAMRDAVEREVYLKCGVLDIFRDPEQSALVHQLDAAMLAAEKRDLLRGWHDVPLPEWAPRERIRPMHPLDVRAAYLDILKQYAPALAVEFMEAP